MRLEEFRPAAGSSEATGDSLKIEADAIQVGPITITRNATEDSGGIWLGSGRHKSSIAIFHVPGQVGIGVYAKGFPGPCNVCLCVNEEDGQGMIQFAKGKEVAYLTFDDVKKLLALLDKETP